MDKFYISNIDVVFISTCHSEFTVKAFSEAKHVIYIDQRQEIDDKVAQKFAA